MSQNSHCFFSACFDCPTGRFQPSSGSSSCNECSPGQYQPSEGVSWGCRTCIRGRFSSFGQASCTDCPRGRFASSSGSGECRACQAGQYQTSTRSTGCRNTPAGFWTPAEYTVNPTTRASQRCPAGRFSSSGQGKSNDCEGPCEPGYYCGEGSSTPREHQCRAGYYGREGEVEDTCHDLCPAGRRCPRGSGEQNSVIGQPCSSSSDVSRFCPRGTGASANTVRSGYYTVPENEPQVREAEERCPKGYYCSGGLRFACPAGRYGSSEGLTSSQCSGECEAGFFCPGNTGSPTSGPQEHSVRPRQELCGDASQYCPAGTSTRRTVSSGYFSIPEDAPSDRRTGQAECSVDYSCDNGVRTRKVQFTDEVCGPGGSRWNVFEESLKDELSDAWVELEAKNVVNGDDAEIMYELVSQEPETTDCNVNNPFQVVSENNKAFLKSSEEIRFAFCPTFQLTFIAKTGKRGDAMSEPCTLEVAMIEKNNDPEFDEPTPITRVVEQASERGTEVGDPIRASDPDPGQELSFQITDGNGDGIFRIGGCTGQITVVYSRRTDPEAQENPALREIPRRSEPYELTIEVSDDHQDPLTVTTTVSIEVEPVNEPPEFRFDDCEVLDGFESRAGKCDEFDVVESQDRGSALDPWRPPVSDPDGDDLTFTFTSTGNDRNTFSINEDTGEVTVNRPELLDFEAPANNPVAVEIEMSDGEYSVRGTLRINVINANDPPVVASPEWTVKEDIDVEMVIGTLEADDPDAKPFESDAPLTFALVEGSLGDRFRIDPSTGEVLVKSPVGRESEKYTLLVDVTDSGSQPRGETQASYEEPKTTRGTIVIYVERVNLPPVLIAPSEALDGAFKLDEGTYSSEVPVGDKFSYDDPDNDDCVFFLEEDSEFEEDQEPNALERFSIDWESGQLFARGELDYRSRTEYSFFVVVRDPGRLRDKLRWSVKLQIVPRPARITTAEFSILEDLPNGYGVGQLGVEDDDDPDADWSEYTFALPGSADGRFGILSNGTVLVLDTDRLDFRVEENRTLTLNATVTKASNGLTSWAPVDVSLRFVNRPPTFVPGQVRSLDRTSVSNGQRVGSPLEATDPDGPSSEEIQEWKILSVESPNNSVTDLDALFTIGNRSGQLAIHADELDGGLVFRVEIQVRDIAGAADSGFMTVRITDGNFPPEILGDSIEPWVEGFPHVPETMEPGVIVTILIQDRDVSDHHSMSIDQVTPSLYDLDFRIRRVPDSREQSTIELGGGGSVTVVQERFQLLLVNPVLDFQSGDTEFALDLSVRDNGDGRLQDLAEFKFYVKDMPLPPTMRRPSDSFSVPETAGEGDIVGQIYAEDRDFDEMLTFSIGAAASGDSTSPDFPFRIDTNGTYADEHDGHQWQGILRVSRDDALDYFDQNVFVFLVNVTDKDDLSAIAEVTVDVDLVNTPPTIDDAEFSIAESAGLFAEVGKVNAFDREDDKLTFSIVAGDEGDFFRMDGPLMQLNNLVDFEIQPIHKVTVQVVDSNPDHARNATVHVTLLDVNDLVIDDVTGATEHNTTGGEIVHILGSGISPEWASEHPNNVSATISNGDRSYVVPNCWIVEANERVDCETVEGVGRDFQWTLTVDNSVFEQGALAEGQSSDDDVTRYTSPSLVAVNGAEGLDTRGGNLVVLVGHNLGPRAYGGQAISAWCGPDNDFFRFHVEDCSVTSAHTELSCRTVQGAGSDLAWMVEVGGQRSSERDRVGPSSYARPEIISFRNLHSSLETDGSGDDDDQAQLEINGTNFGNDLEEFTVRVSYGPDDEYGGVYVPHRCKMIVEHTSIVCEAVPGIGTDHRALVTVAHQSSDPSADTISYDPPRLAGMDEGSLEEGSTRGGDRIILQGDNLPREGEPLRFFWPLQSFYGPGWDGRHYEMEDCRVTVSYSEIECFTVEGSGRDHTPWVVVGGQQSNALLNETISYHAPVVIDYLDDDVISPGAVDGHTSGFQSVMIDGRHFGPVDTPVTNVTYQNDDMEFRAINCTVSRPHTRIECLTSPGAGRSFEWFVTIDGQVSETATTNYAPPTIHGFSAPPDVADVSVDALSTDGGQRIHIKGDNLGTQEFLGTVTYGPNGRQYEAKNCIFVENHFVIECDTVPGSGVGLHWVVRVGAQTSDPSESTTSYAPPHLERIAPNHRPTEAHGDVIEVEGTDFAIGDLPSRESIRVHFKDRQGIRILGEDATFGNIDGQRSHHFVQFRLPEDFGKEVEVRLEVNGILSNPVSFFYEVPSIRTLHTRPIPGGQGKLLGSASGSSFCRGSWCGEVFVDGNPAPLIAFEGNDPWTHDRVIFELPMVIGSDGIDVQIVVGGDDSRQRQESDVVKVEGVNPVVSLIQNQELLEASYDTRGGERITVVGVERIGDQPDIVEVTIGGRACTNVTLSGISEDSDTADVSCTTPEGEGREQQVIIARGGFDSESGIDDIQLDYKPPSILSARLDGASEGSTLIQDPVPTEGGIIVLEGENFGISEPGLSIVDGAGEGYPVDTAVRRHSHNRVEFVLFAGDGGGLTLTLQQGGEHGDDAQVDDVIFRYRPPLVSAVHVPAGIVPTAGGVEVVIQGEDFGVTMPSVIVGGEVCAIVPDWQPSPLGNGSEVRCTLPEGQGRDQQVEVLVNGQSSNDRAASLRARERLLASFSGNEVTFDPPEIHGINPGSGPTSGALDDGSPVNVTINGSNFGTSGSILFLDHVDGSGWFEMVRIDSDDATTWTHNTITFQQPEGQGTPKRVVVEVSGQRSEEGPWTFSYDPPTIREVDPDHGPTRGGMRVVIRGNSFGTTNGIAQIGNRTCNILSDRDSGLPLHSHREIQCETPQGLGENLTVAVQAGVQRTEAEAMFSYDPPNIFTIVPNTPNANGQQLEIAGENFGFEDSPTRVVVGGLECLNASRRSDEELVCQMQRDVASRKNLTIEVAYQTSFFEERRRMVAPTCIIGEWALEQEFCLTCPDGARCPGETRRIVSVEGWWRSDLDVSDSRCHPLRQEGAPLHPNRTTCPFMVPCQPPEACEGENTCASGYTGFRCQNCAEGFFKVSGTGECRECPDRPYLLIGGLVVGALVACGAAYVMNRKNINLAFMAIGIDYFQVLAIFANSRVAWPPLIREIFRIMSAFNFNLELSAPECVAPDVGYAHKWFFIHALPIAGTIFFATIHFLKVVHKRCILCQKKNLHGHLPTMISVLIVMFYVLYLFITQMTLDVFNCQQIRPDDTSMQNPDDEQYMAGMTDIPCNEPGGTHLLLLPFAITSLVLYGIGFPVAVFVFLRKNKENVKKDQLLRARGLGNTRHDNPELYVFRKKFHKLYYFFKPGKWYWILMIIARKCLIAFSSLMFATTPSFQMACSLLVMFGAYALQVRHVPFMSMSDRAKVLEEHRLKAMMGSGPHAAIASDFADWHRQNRRAARSETAGWSSVMESKNAKERVSAASLYFFDYNTVEAVLLFCAVLINLAGIMFESERFEGGQSATEVDALTYITLTIIFASVGYFLIVFVTEVLSTCAPECAARCCRSKKGNLNKNAGADDLEGIGLGDDDGTEQDTEFMNNPMIMSEEGDFASGVTAEQIMQMTEPPSSHDWSAVRQMFSNLVQDNTKLQEDIRRSKREVTLSSGAPAGGVEGSPAGRRPTRRRPAHMARAKRLYSSTPASASRRNLAAASHGPTSLLDRDEQTSTASPLAAANEENA